MQTLYVVYDPQCGLCTEVKEWLVRQPSYVTLRLVPAGTPEAEALYPRRDVDEVAVVSDDGQVWLGNRAWLVILWALRRYRTWARRLSAPALQPLARQAYGAIAHNRIAISELLGLRSETALKQRLENVVLPTCQIPNQTQPNA